MSNTTTPNPARIGLDDLTLGELADIEDIAGRRIADLGDGMDFKTSIAFAFVLKRRENPNFSLEQARNLRASELASVLGVLDLSGEEVAPEEQASPDFSDAASIS